MEVLSKELRTAKADTQLYQTRLSLYPNNSSTFNIAWGILSSVVQKLREKRSIGRKTKSHWRLRWNTLRKRFQIIVGEEGQWTSQKELFLKSPEFFYIFDSRSAFLLKRDFDGAIQQFQEAGYPPASVPLDFLGLQKVADRIPEDRLRY